MSELLIKNKITGEWEAIPYIIGPQGPQGEKGNTGLKGADGITPHIGANGNWFIEETDTGMPSRGEGGADDLSFDRTTGMLYLMYKGQNLGNGVYLGIPAPDNNNAVLTLENTSGWTAKSFDKDAACILDFNWSSIEGDVSTGDGTVVVKIGGVVKYNKSIWQGEHSIDITEYLALGYNLVNLSVFDVYNNRQSVTFGVTVYDISNLNSIKLINRTLTGEYVNDRVTAVGSGSFSNLNNITIRLNNVTSLSYNARTFYGENVNVYLPNVVAAPQYSFRDNRINLISIPKATTVANNAFYYCGSIQYVDLTAVESIGTHLGSSVQNYIIRNTEQVVPAAAANSVPTKHLYVPGAMVDAYKNATIWCDIADKIRPLEEYTLDGTVTGELDFEKMESEV